MQIAIGWVATLIIAGFVAAFFTAFGVFSPNKIASQAAVPIVATLNANTKTMIAALNQTALNNGTGAGLSVSVSVRALTVIGVIQSCVVWFPVDPSRMQGRFQLTVTCCMHAEAVSCSCVHDGGTGHCKLIAVRLSGSLQALNSSLASMSKAAVRWPLAATQLNNKTFALYSRNVCRAT